MERNAKIDPALKAWLDNVLVPIMVREYLAPAHEARDNVSSPDPAEGSETPPSEQFQ
jgi:hypothetical protein